MAELNKSKEIVEIIERLDRIEQRLDQILAQQSRAEKEWLTVEEAGKRLSYSKHQIYELIHSDRGFPHVQLWAKGEYRIPVKAFEEWAESQQQQNQQ